MNPAQYLEVQDHEDDVIQMEQIRCTQAGETLGVMQALSCNESAELEYIQKKIQRWVGKLWATSLQRKDVIKATHMTIMKQGLLEQDACYDVM